MNHNNWKNRRFWIRYFHCSKRRKLSSAQYLIEKEGIDVNKKAEKGYGYPIYEGKTALHVAWIKGHLQIVQYLIEDSADIEYKDEDQRNLLQTASRNSKLDVIKDLVSKRANKRNKKKLFSGINAFHFYFWWRLQTE